MCVCWMIPTKKQLLQGLGVSWHIISTAIINNFTLEWYQRHRRIAGCGAWKGGWSVAMRRVVSGKGMGGQMVSGEGWTAEEISSLQETHGLVNVLKQLYFRDWLATAKGADPLCKRISDTLNRIRQFTRHFSFNVQGNSLIHSFWRLI